MPTIAIAGLPAINVVRAGPRGGSPVETPDTFNALLQSFLAATA